MRAAEEDLAGHLITGQPLVYAPAPERERAERTMRRALFEADRRLHRSVATGSPTSWETLTHASERQTAWLQDAGLGTSSRLRCQWESIQRRHLEELLRRRGAPTHRATEAAGRAPAPFPASAPTARPRAELRRPARQQAAPRPHVPAPRSTAPPAASPPPHAEARAPCPPGIPSVVAGVMTQQIDAMWDTFVQMVTAWPRRGLDLPAPSRGTQPAGDQSRHATSRPPPVEADHGLASSGTRRRSRRRRRPRPTPRSESASSDPREPSPKRPTTSTRHQPGDHRQPPPTRPVSPTPAADAQNSWRLVGPRRPRPALAAATHHASGTAPRGAELGAPPRVAAAPPSAPVTGASTSRPASRRARSASPSHPPQPQAAKLRWHETPLNAELSPPVPFSDDEEEGERPPRVRSEPPPRTDQSGAGIPRTYATAAGVIPPPPTYVPVYVAGDSNFTDIAFFSRPERVRPCAARGAAFTDTLRLLERIAQPALVRCIVLGLGTNPVREWGADRVKIHVGLRRLSEALRARFPNAALYHMPVHVTALHGLRKDQGGLVNSISPYFFRTLPRLAGRTDNRGMHYTPEERQRVLETLLELSQRAA